jgi:hypothetical protein
MMKRERYVPDSEGDSGGDPALPFVPHTPQTDPDYEDVPSTPPHRGAEPPGPLPPPPPLETNVVSKTSGYAPFETFTNDFNFEAIPFYQFWTIDELVNDSEERGNQSFDEIPRFVKLVWDPAPDLKTKVVGDIGQRRGPTTPFGLGGAKNIGASLNGIQLNPEHLQPANFETVAQSLANGHIAPGVIETVVDARVSLPVARVPSFPDEDEYLADPNSRGLPYSVLKNAWLERYSSVLGIQRTLEAGKLVDGQFASPRPSHDGVLSLLSANPSSPSISFYGKVAFPDDRVVLDRLREIAEPVTPPSSNSDDLSPARVRFIDPGIDGIVEEESMQTMTRPEHVEALAALAPHLENLIVLAESGRQYERREINIPSFPVPGGLPRLEYVGYIIEKYALEDGAFVLKDTMYLGGREFTELYDTKVKYGTVYRYRLRGVVRWVRPRGVGVFGRDQTALAATNRAITAYAPYEASYFGSEWSDRWAYAALVDQMPPDPPDEIRVMPMSPEGAIYVSGKMPWNPQRDVYKMALLRRKITPEEEGDWELLAEFGPRNWQYIDRAVEKFDVTGARYLYTAISYTKHGEESPLSDQLAARISGRWQKDGELPVEFVSCAGVDRDASGPFRTYPEQREFTEVIKEGVGELKISAQERIGRRLLRDADYIVRIESLDTGEMKDLPVKVKYETQPTVRTDQVHIIIRRK